MVCPRTYLIRSMWKSLLKRIGEPNHPPGNKETGAAVPHQKMKGVENILGSIVIEAVIHVVIHPLIIEIATVLGQKGDGKNPLGRSLVAAENTQNIINTEIGTLPADPVMVLRGNIQKPGKRNENGGIEHKHLFSSFLSSYRNFWSVSLHGTKPQNLTVD